MVAGGVDPDSHTPEGLSLLEAAAHHGQGEVLTALIAGGYQFTSPSWLLFVWGGGGVATPLAGQGASCAHVATVGAFLWWKVGVGWSSY